MTKPLAPVYAVLLVSCATPPGADVGEPYSYRSERLTVVLDPRTPEQIAAFYEARGFAAPMVALLGEQCYITVFIQNTGPDVVWLDLSQWRFSGADGEIMRLDRDHWRQHWQAMGIPLAHQSTFRWTLLPEVLDFRPDEREGGNIILPRTGQAVAVTARFDTGADRSGTPIQVRFDNVRCMESR